MTKDELLWVLSLAMDYRMFMPFRSQNPSEDICKIEQWRKEFASYPRGSWVELNFLEESGIEEPIHTIETLKDEFTHLQECNMVIRKGYYRIPDGRLAKLCEYCNARRLPADWVRVG